MKIDTLRLLCTRRPRVKLCVVAEAFCLCGYASNPRATAAGLLVDIGTSVRVSFGSHEMIDEPASSGTLLLDATCKVTRRIQTHRRHLHGRDVGDDYMARALSL